MRLAHRVHTSAAPGQVWALLGSPGQWPQFDVLLRGVRGGSGRAVAGERLMALLRLSAVGVPVDVVEAVPERRLVLDLHLLPGLRERVTYELTSALQGGTDITVSVVVEGVLAVPAAVPMWLYDGLTSRVLAARADRAARSARRSAA